MRGGEDKLKVTAYICTLHMHTHCTCTTHTPQLLDEYPIQILVLKDVEQHVSLVTVVAEVAEFRWASLVTQPSSPVWRAFSCRL